MKKIYIAMAVLATVALASCQKEKSFNDSTPIGENTVVFSVGGAASTKALDGAFAVKRGISIPLGTDEFGNTISLEETITNLDFVAPATKGTPAYTENVGVLYKDNLNVVGDNGVSATAATFVSMDSEIYLDKNKIEAWRYNHVYSSDPWAEGAVGFYLNMPAAPKNVAFGDNARADGKFTFSYTSPAEAKDQEDILFAYRKLDKQEHNSFLPAGAPVLFNHALTAVKFAIGNPDADIDANDIEITYIAFKGLYDKGTCEIKPAVENNYRDNRTGEYSSSSADVTKWKDLEKTEVDINSGLYGEPVDYNKGGSFGDKGTYPDSYAAAGNEKNLNKADGSQTFWLIPQTISSEVSIYIEYSFGGNDYTFDLKIGDVLNGIEWKAGEMRTYTITIDDVNVKIEDTVTTTAETVEGVTLYKGTKNGVKITNTGNTDAFIRAAIIGQWVDENDAPVFSFTDFATPDDIIKEIDSWYNDQFGTGTGYFGVFNGLVGYSNSTYSGEVGTANAGWVKGNDGYYYYTTAVKPTEATGTALFNSYTVKEVPVIRVAGKVQKVHFEMEISTQAISAKKLDTSTYAWNKAWENAIGYDPSSTN